jgi:RimJ/RimL family protein N-acetyltransferase
MIYKLTNNYYVRGLKESDLSGEYPSWFEDQEINQYNSHGTFPKTESWFRSYYESINNENHIIWAICHQDDGHIGNVSLQSINNINRNAEFAILVGNKSHWGKSIGTEAGFILLNHGFSKLNLERIYCGTSSTNKGMNKLAEKLGMQKEGLRRKHLFLEGKWVDMIEYGILKDEFIERHTTS